jgi:streptomycin 6-kinase
MISDSFLKYDNIVKKWNLHDLAPYQNLNHNYVAFGFQNKNPVVLKMGKGLEKEALALRCLQRFGGVRVLDQDENALLLERIIPGDLIGFNDVKTVCDVIRKLHQAPIPEEGFPFICNWLEILDRPLYIPFPYLKKAQNLKNKLLETQGSQVFLHGDLHHGNILNNGNGWSVIDPHGVIGEVVYEVAAFIRNPMPGLLDLENATDIINDRIFKFSKYLNLDPKRIHDWCFVQAVLAWGWALEDGADASYFKKLTQIFDQMVYL